MRQTPRSDLPLVDAYELRAEDYEDIPELSDEWFETAEYRIADRLIRVGRPPLEPEQGQP